MKTGNNLSALSRYGGEFLNVLTHTLFLTLSIERLTAKNLSLISMDILKTKVSQNYKKEIKHFEKILENDE